MRYRVGQVIGEISSLPGCSQIGISHTLFVPKEQRGKGEAKKVFQLRERLFFEKLGYDLMLCTVVSTNKAQIRLMETNGWAEIASFESSKTDNKVSLYCKKPTKKKEN